MFLLLNLNKKKRTLFIWSQQQKLKFPFLFSQNYWFIQSTTIDKDISSLEKREFQIEKNINRM